MKIKIISGGQTGADRAALDAAIELGMDYGGSIPKGRLAEDGMLDLRYDKMTELKSYNYDARTKKNVIDSDATLIFTMGAIGDGTTYTMEVAQKYNRPFLHIDLLDETDREAVKIVKKWIKKIRPNILNVAGSRESTSRGIYEKVFKILKEVLMEVAGIEPATFSLRTRRSPN